MEVIARINIDTPTGRKLVHEIERHKRVAEIEYPLPEELQSCTAQSHNEVWNKVWDKLSKHYGVDVRKLRLNDYQLLQIHYHIIHHYNYKDSDKTPNGLTIKKWQ